MKHTVYTSAGKEKGTIELPEGVFGQKWNADLVHQVATSIQSNARAATAHTKDRGEVSGGGKKPWKQKGTGRARHGSSRSPIWVGGGVAHGPRNDKNYTKKINYKMKAKALFVVLSEKLRKGEILFVDSINTSKTKDAHTVFMNLSKIDGFSRLAGKRKTALLVYPELDESFKLSIKNLPQIVFDHLKDINVVDVLQTKYLVMTQPEKAIEFFEAKLQK